MAHRLAVLADTHLHESSPRDRPPRAWEEIERADLVLHAGAVDTDRVELTPDAR